MNIRDKIRDSVNTAEVVRQDYTSRYFEIKVFVYAARHELDRSAIHALQNELMIKHGGIAAITYLVGDDGYEVSINNIVANITEIEVGDRTLRGSW